MYEIEKGEYMDNLFSLGIYCHSKNPFFSNQHRGTDESISNALDLGSSELTIKPHHAMINSVELQICNPN